MQKRLIWVVLIFLAGCTFAAEPDGGNTPVPSRSAATEADGADFEPAGPTDLPVQRNRRVEMEERYSFAISLGFDSIRPIYSPEFTSAEDAPLDDNELVLGVAWEGEAKAYPISVLRYREMVDDELAGIPTLVTW